MPGLSPYLSYSQRWGIVLALLLGAAAASCNWFSTDPVVPGDAADDDDPAAETLEEEPGDAQEDVLAETPDQPRDEIPAEVPEEEGGDTTAPSTPPNLTAAPYSHYAIDLHWDPSTDNVGVSGYIIYRDGTEIGNSPSSFCRDGNATPGSTYSYRVSAYDAAGNLSGPSTPALATAPAITVRYEILKTLQPVTVDGNLDEFSTANYLTLVPPDGGDIARIKALWDTEAVYISYEVTDSQLNATETVQDGDVWSDDAVEIFFDVNNESAGFNTPADTFMLPDDYQIIVNILNVHADSRGSESGEPSNAWDGDYESAVLFQGTIGNNADFDSGFALEIAVPWTTLGLTDPPPDDTVMGIAFTHEDLDESTFSFIMWPDITDSPFRNSSRWPDVRLSSTVAP